MSTRRSIEFLERITTRGEGPQFDPSLRSAQEGIPTTTNITINACPLDSRGIWTPVVHAIDDASADERHPRQKARPFSTLLATLNSDVPESNPWTTKDRLTSIPPPYLRRCSITIVSLTKRAGCQPEWGSWSAIARAISSR